jgi:sterol desaturase/sphingolipid hydroxylase (fatty acid hydroxylase superfamily)
MYTILNNFYSNNSISKLLLNINKIVSSIFLLTSLTSIILVIPLVLTNKDTYKFIIPIKYYNDKNIISSYFGLIIGLLSVAIGQTFTLLYFYLLKNNYILTNSIFIQKKQLNNYIYYNELIKHLFQPEGFILVGGYLIFTWIYKIMPLSYYSFIGGIIWIDVLLQLLIQDSLQFIMHIIQHKSFPIFYKISHKPHHKFTNPKLFDSFNGSCMDTLIMIIFPLFITAQLVHTNIWSYITFGTLYANWLVLIHSEYSHSWDYLFRLIGFGTSGDHHVHHKLFVYNYGHLFMYWDIIYGTYKSPLDVDLFNEDI